MTGQQRSMIVSVAVIASTLVVGTLACGVESEPPPASRAATNEYRLPASAATQSELGVVAWSLDNQNPAASVKGHDSDDRVVVEFEHVSTTDPNDATRRLEAYILHHGEDFARLVLAVREGRPTFIESSFTGKYERTMELLEEDLKLGRDKAPAGPSLATTSLGASTLRPLGPSRETCGSYRQLVQNQCTWLLTQHHEAEAAVPGRCKNDCAEKHPECLAPKNVDDAQACNSLMSSCNDAFEQICGQALGNADGMRNSVGKCVACLNDTMNH